ncbi:MAG: alpha/beta fold hydrolase [Ilumatobacteraceae bacterium]
MSDPTIVLVHGAWHGAWCWDLVRERLESAGVHVVAVDLPGHGASREPLADLHGDAAAVTSALDCLDGPAVLVGHSYGGAVVTEAGAHDRVAHVVYIAAFNLAHGECVGRAAADEAAAADIDHSGRPALGAALTRVDGGESTTVIAELAAPIFYNDCTAETASWAIAQLGRQRMANFSDQPSAIAWLDRPSTYVTCRDDNAVHPDLQRILARRATTSIEWPTGHTPFLSQPQLVSELLLDIAAGVTTP